MRSLARARLPALAGMLFVGLLGSQPAGAQWIGAPGGSGEGASSGAVTITPAPQTTSPGIAPGFSTGGFTPATPMPQQANPDMADCQRQVEKLRGDLEARGESIQKAAKGKRPPSELCPLFRNFANAQQGFYDYLTTNKAKCGVPDDVLKKIKENVASVTSTRNRVCEVAKVQESGGGAGPGGPPAQGSVSAGLGLPSGLPSMAAPPGGVFDTLGGDALR